jgi:thioredoxin-like negative regulator of GroEL
MTVFPTIRSRFAAVCSAGWLLLLVPATFAEEVQWRSDYQKARQESVEKNRPLVIDFGTESCFWCKQLDTRTFIDPAVAGLLNDSCVPLKVDANRFPTLTEALQITAFPTIVFAGPDGRILGFQEGFVEAPRMKELLHKAIGAVSTPEWMTRDFQEASKAATAGETARSVALLKTLLEDGKDRPVQAKARRLLADLEKQAAVRIERARQMLDAGQAAEATETLNDIVKGYAGTPAAREGTRLLQSLAARHVGNDPDRARKARDLLALAREEYRAQQFGICLDRCESLAAAYSDLPEALQATQLAAEIKGNPEWLKQACDQTGDRLAVLYLALAETWLRKGQPQQAVFYLERVMQNFPNTRHAEAAQVRLSQVQGLPMRQIDLKK